MSDSPKDVAKVNAAPAFSPVWIVPILALVIALWLAFQDRFERGRLVDITFSEAADLVAGETQIRLNDVPVGVVKRVRLNSDLKSVVVTARMDPEMTPYLTDQTRFWMVTPRISTTGVSNLGTLISGVFIFMDPSDEGEAIAEFRGLDEAPAYESRDEGTLYVLESDSLGSLDIGSPVHYRDIKVGEIVGYELSSERDLVQVTALIRHPYDSLVKARSRFWNVSGVNVNVGAEGINAQVASLASLISGGVAFDNTATMGDAEQAQPMSTYQLYADRESLLEGRYQLKYFYRSRFAASAKGLRIGSDVEFQGIKIGEVIDVELLNAGAGAAQIEVYYTIEPQRLDPTSSPSRQEMDAMITGLVQDGLRASMVSANLLTGTKAISLAIIASPTNPGAELVVNKNYSEIPAALSGSDQIAERAADFIEKINRIPLDKIGRDLAGSLDNFNRLLTSLNDEGTIAQINQTLASSDRTLQQAGATLEQLRASIAAIESSFNSQSQTQQELVSLLENMNDASYSLQGLIDQLQQKPNSLLTGNRGTN